MFRLSTIITFSCLLTAPLAAAMPPPMNLSQEEELVINNRILLKVRGKPLTVMDVVRKMDLLFYRQFPELAGSAAARYQFYTNAWRSMLAAVIDDQLIMADAEEKQIKVSDGEVREELEKGFGPDVVFNLDKIGLSLDEAFELLQTELTVARMTNMMVRSKAITDVHPKMVRTRYEERVAVSSPEDHWRYQVLSIRGEEHSEIAAEAHRLLHEQELPFENVVAQLGNRGGGELSVSEVYDRPESDLSLSHKAVLQTLAAGGYSSPATKGDVSRIFCLREHQEGKHPSFNDIADEIKWELTQEVTSRHNVEYRKKLREHYGMTDKYLDSLLPEDLQPFALR